MMGYLGVIIGVALLGMSFIFLARMNLIKKELEQMEELAYKQQIRLESNITLKRMLQYWIEKGIQNKTIIEYLKQNGIYRLAIYGMTDMGVMLYHILEDTNIEVVCGIDRSKKFVNLPIQIVKPKEFSITVDAIVVTSIYYFSEIYDIMRQQIGEDVPILGLDEILYDIGEEV